MSLSERLLALHDLHQRGFLTDAQFTLAKAREIEATGRTGVDPVPAPPLPVPVVSAPPPMPPPAPTPVLKPVIPGVGLALGAAAAANGGLTG